MEDKQRDGAASARRRKRRNVIGLIVAVALVGLLLLLYRQITHNNSPIADESGVPTFDGALAEDILSEGEALLTIEYANVKDNGEGKWPPHGPYGSIHAVIYSPEQLPQAPWQPELELHKTMLYGPHQTVGDLFEWLDDEELAYINYALYDWNLYAFDQVVLRLYESDPGPGREHDDLLAVVVSKQETQAQAMTFRSDQMEISIRTRDLTR